ncbi:MAG: hypothetical protein WC980_06450 [Candidatus Brocadiia bacterium]
MMINRIIITLALIILSGWVGYAQADQPQSILSPYIQDDTLSPTGTITITGKTNLSVGTAIKCLIKGKLTTDRADQIKLLEIIYTSVYEDNFWAVEIPSGYLKSWDGFEIELTASEPKHVKEYYYFDILSPDLSRRRLDTAHFIWASFSDALVLDEELNQLISTMEQAKQNKPKIEQLIKTPLGIYKSREEAMAGLIKRWEAWEKDWHKKLLVLLPVVNDYNRSHLVFPASQEKLQQYVNTIKEQYIRYHQRFIGPLNDKPGDLIQSISHYSITDTNAWYRNTENEKTNFSRVITKELSAKFLKDITTWLEHFIWSGTNQDEQLFTHHEKLRARASEYFKQLNDELEQYNKSETPFIRLQETLELMTQIGQFTEKSDADPEMQNYIISLKNKLEVLYDELR